MSDATLIELIVKLKQACMRHEARVCDKLNLSPSEYSALLALPPEGVSRAQAVAQTLGLSASRTSRVLEGLVQSGLLTRQPDDQDRRALALKLSPKGRRAQSAIFRALQACEQSLTEALSEEAQAEARRGLLRLTEALREGKE